MICCRKAGASQVAKYLMEQKADPEAVTALGDTALQIAQRLGHHDTVLAMCSEGAPLRPGTPRQRQPSPGPMTPRRSGSSHGAPTAPVNLPRPPPVPLV